MNRPVRLLLIALAMTAILAGLVAAHVHARRSGTEIELDLQPVDPRDLLLGHYVEIRTPIHSFDTRDFSVPQEDWQVGDTVFVALKEAADASWHAVGLYRTEPDAELESGAVLIRGRVRFAHTARDFGQREVNPSDGGEPFSLPEPVEGSEHRVISVNYNIERYYADRQTALALEAMRNEDRLRLILSVSDDGSAVIKGLRIDGEARYETLF